MIAARRAGALEIVATDVAEAPLAAARKVGADSAVNVTEPDALTRYGTDKGCFDVMFEASGNAAALAGGLGVVRPTGIVVQIGIAGGEMSLPMNVAVAKEIELRGTFRFHEEFALAVALIGGGLVDVMPLLTETVPLADARAAFELAADRSRAMKVQLAFTATIVANCSAGGNHQASFFPTCFPGPYTIAKPLGTATEGSAA